MKEEKKNSKTKKIILIIAIIILLLLFWLFGYRIGKIGHGTREIVSDSTTSQDKDEQIDMIRVVQNDIDVTKSTHIDIFKNDKFQGEKIIAPKSRGDCKFCIENLVNDNIKYSINFSEEMEHKVNMKYRLKIDNIYVRGNQDTYVELKELNLDDIVVLKGSNNIFTLEWYWEDDDEKDTIVGSVETDEYYTLNLKINSTKLTK